MQQCAILLFEKMQVTALPFSFIGPYRHLINQMLRNFQLSQGIEFHNPQLDLAYRDKLHANYATNQTKTVLQDNISLFIDYINKCLMHDKLEELTNSLRDSILPKFDSLLLDKINGMGITVHDVYATKIEILRLEVNNYGWKASVRFTGQDHFGLDVDDIRKKNLNNFSFSKYGLFFKDLINLVFALS